MKGYFITGTDTGVGKTLVSAALTLALEASYWKPIQSGLADEMSDHERVAQLTALDATHFQASTYRLQASLSPDQAAKRENIEIDFKQCVLQPTQKSYQIVEGAGGVYVPLNERENMLDLIRHLKLAVIVVCRGGLGTINHSLLSIMALHQHNIPIQGIVFSGNLNPENQVAIEKWGRVKTLFHLPQFEDLSLQVFQTWVKNNDSVIKGIG